MPLTLAKAGEKNYIRRVGGKDSARTFLCNLGFTEGSEITVIAMTAGNLIVSIKDTRVAISKEMANRIAI